MKKILNKNFKKGLTLTYKQFHFKGIYSQNTKRILKTCSGGEVVKWNKKKQGKMVAPGLAKIPNPFVKHYRRLQTVSSQGGTDEPVGIKPEILAGHLFSKHLVLGFNPLWIK